MCVRSLPLLLIAALGAQAEWHFEPPKPEGEGCGGRRGPAVWTCQRESACTSFLKIQGKRIICNKDQGERTMCCWNPRTIYNRKPDNISERKCREYQARVTCPSRARGELLQSFARLELEKGKWRERGENGLEKMDVENIFLNKTVTQESTLLGKIINGNIARAKELPHSALVGYGPLGTPIFWGCGGTLISERYVLSAAHCSFIRSLGSARWVRLGDLNYASSSDNQYVQDFTIIKRINHPEYSDSDMYNDIALYKLDRAAVFNEYVAPACLYTSISDPLGLATASGWGDTGIYAPTNTVLRVVDLEFVRCDDGLKEKTIICAWRDGKDTCYGDSGGPLILADWKGSCLPRLVGITSNGPPCPSPREDPAVYTRVAAFRPWIESIVWPQY